MSITTEYIIDKQIESVMYSRNMLIDSNNTLNVAYTDNQSASFAESMNYGINWQKTVLDTIDNADFHYMGAALSITPNNNKLVVWENSDFSTTANLKWKSFENNIWSSVNTINPPINHKYAFVSLTADNLNNIHMEIGRAHV